jgi:hypothetical protein
VSGGQSTAPMPSRLGELPYQRAVAAGTPIGSSAHDLVLDSNRPRPCLPASLASSVVDVGDGKPSLGQLAAA